MKLILGVLLFCKLLYATPLKIEMIFLSNENKVSLLKTIDSIIDLKKYKSFSQVDMAKCVPMGEGCFHPQLGYIEKSKTEINSPKLIKDEEVKLKTFNAIDTSLVNCDKNYYFDIYCGKEKKEISSSSEIQVWFDISSSLRQVDYNKDSNYCNRRLFLEKILEKCKKKLQVSIYNTSIKEMGELSSVCMSYGTNDEERLISWMKDSKARNLLLVTDVDEMSLEMKSFLEKNGAKLIGDGVKSFTSK
jgi:hypothetical protein